MKDGNNKTTTYQYDNVGRLEWTYRPNNTKRHVTYDNAGQITKIEELDADDKVIALFSYPAYWNNGQPAKQFSVPALPLGAKVHQATMTFDSENRVAKWNNQTAALTVVHDVDGNMTSGPLPPLLPGPGQQSPGLGAFGYDSRNRLLSCNGVSYTYAAENLRTKVTTTAGVTNWVLNSAGAPAQPLVRTAPGGAITRYVWGLGLLYEVADGDTQPTRTYHYDRRGSTVALSNADGRTITDRWAYGPYGERLSHSGTSDTPFQFNGFFGVQTDTNGLLYMNARYYNVETRRFTAADPAGFGASANFYWFANADPFSLADPFGLGAQDTSGGSVSWKNPDGSVKWGTYLWEALAGVPDYLKNNGASSFKRNITDPKFVLENRSGGLGMAAAVERGSAIASERAAAEGTLQTTVHGAERIAGAAATRGGVLSEAGVAAVRQGGRVMTQADGATVRILEAEPGRFNVVIENAQGKVITTIERFPQNKIGKLSQKFGWK